MPSFAGISFELNHTGKCYQATRLMNKIKTNHWSHVATLMERQLPWLYRASVTAALYFKVIYKLGNLLLKLRRLSYVKMLFYYVL